jgi:hypothetical protein
LHLDFRCYFHLVFTPAFDGDRTLRRADNRDGSADAKLDCFGFVIRAFDERFVLLDQFLLVLRENTWEKKNN